jgi:hypothetical protein
MLPVPGGNLQPDQLHNGAEDAKMSPLQSGHLWLDVPPLMYRNEEQLKEGSAIVMPCPEERRFSLYICLRD